MGWVGTGTSSSILYLLDKYSSRTRNHIRAGIEYTLCEYLYNFLIFTYIRGYLQKK